MSAFEQELLKMALQLFGALLLAWMTVRWALGRYKSEKMWERRTAALADVMTALRDMARVHNIWLAAYLAQRDAGYEPKLNDRIEIARKKFDDVSSIATLVLPDPFPEIIAETEKKLDAERDEDWFLRVEAGQKAVMWGLGHLLSAIKKHPF